MDAAPLVILAGVVGARAYYVLLKPGYFLDHPGEIVNLRLGGLTIHGAIVAGVLTLWWYARRRRQRLLAWLDVMVPGLALAQAIGRWGNWANQEAFGTPSDLPWAVEIAPHRRPDAYAAAETFHPTFLYESIFNLLNAVVLAWLAANLPRTRLREGDVVHGPLPGQHGRPLRDQPEQAGPPSLGRRGAADPHVAGRRRYQVGNDPQQRRLAAAGRPDERDELAGRDLEVNGVEREVAAEAARDGADRDRR